MRILVIGATGGSGRAVTDELLTRGHDVTAFSRHATGLPAQDRLTRVDGDATRGADLDRVMPGHDAVLVTLGISEPPMRVRFRGAKATPDDVRSRGTAEVIAAARRAGIRRLVTQSSYGIGDTRERIGLFTKAFFAVVLKPQIADTARQEDVVRASDLDWTLARPVYLTDGAAADPFVSDAGDTRRPQVSRRALARALADLAEGSTHLHRAVAVSG